MILSMQRQEVGDNYINYLDGCERLTYSTHTFGARLLYIDTPQ